MKYYFQAMSKYATFDGRASRSEYWWYFLSYVCICFVAGFMDGFINGFMHGFGSNAKNPGVILGLVQIAHIVPSLSVYVRRLHDTDRTGWWYFAVFTIVGLIPLFVFSVTRGTTGANRFGSDPLKQNEDFSMNANRRQASVTMNGDNTDFDAVREIERLSALRAAGHLNDAEFTAMKSRVFGRA